MSGMTFQEKRAFLGALGSMAGGLAKGMAGDAVKNFGLSKAMSALPKGGLVQGGLNLLGGTRGLSAAGNATMGGKAMNGIGKAYNAAAPIIGNMAKGQNGPSLMGFKLGSLALEQFGLKLASLQITEPLVVRTTGLALTGSALVPGR